MAEPLGHSIGTQNLLSTDSVCHNQHWFNKQQKSNLGSYTSTTDILAFALTGWTPWQATAECWLFMETQCLPLLYSLLEIHDNRTNSRYDYIF